MKILVVLICYKNNNFWTASFLSIPKLLCRVLYLY